MAQVCDEYEVLISGFIDGELEPDQQAALEAHTAGCSVCRRELESIRALVIGTSNAFAVEEPPAQVWDTFLDNVYNRLERKTGWVIFTAGVILLALYGLILFVMEPWASALTKLLIGLPIIGLLLLFVSVLRQRMRIARSDRYSREIRR